MAIKIDLLPGYVGLKRVLKRLIIACVVLVAAVGGILYLIYYRDQLRLKKLQADVENIETFASRTEAAESAAKAATDAAAPMKSLVSFVADASKTGPERAALLDLTRRYIYWNRARNEGALINLMDFSDGQTVKFTATVPTPDDYARFLLGLRRGSETEGGPLFKDLPKATGVPGFPEGRLKDTTTTQEVSLQPQQIVFPLEVKAEGPLRNPIVVPVEAGSAAAPAAGGAEPGMPGAPGAEAPPAPAP